MTHAYDSSYLPHAQTVLGDMFEYAVYQLQMDIDEYSELFLHSVISDRFSAGSPSVIAGRSGSELVRMVLEDLGISKSFPQKTFLPDRSPEFWSGFSLAYYQWEQALDFSCILRRVSASEICSLYPAYHEMDIRHFSDRMSELCSLPSAETLLAYYRKLNKLSQKALSERSGVPLRTLQQYEQRQKSLAKAQVNYVINLAKALHTTPESLLD